MVNFVEIETFQNMNLVDFEIFKMWILWKPWKMIFSNGEFRGNWNFSKCESCDNSDNWDFQNVIFFDKIRILASVKSWHVHLKLVSTLFQLTQFSFTFNQFVHVALHHILDIRHLLASRFQLGIIRRHFGFYKVLKNSSNEHDFTQFEQRIKTKKWPHKSHRIFNVFAVPINQLIKHLDSGIPRSNSYLIDWDFYSWKRLVEFDKIFLPYRWRQLTLSFHS